MAEDPIRIPTTRQDGDERKMSRPFGVALLLAGYDDKGPQLFFSDPSGTFTQFKAKAIGKGGGRAVPL